MTTDPIDTDLFWFSEWLDSEGLMRDPLDETDDDRTHEQLVRDFLTADEKGEAGRAVPRGKRGDYAETRLSEMRAQLENLATDVSDGAHHTQPFDNERLADLIREVARG